ncbi:leucyl aminopeptidase [Limimaricola hongkongensis]|uniref:Probable cytosol aminopeptidase n=1 Tax=Limimaricola hongkongensis DSM 17492 TaxID=1122180 RepID=A0A017HGT4_9RHOB|nr:leucyl aminopeptidase [Limimaricola hongkongensis]EYD73717.1 Cytosol aminopeptidase PepA [Limimaricola hongkongensis DSM 17492]
MSRTPRIDFLPHDADTLFATPGRIAVFVGPDGPESAVARGLDERTGGALSRLASGARWGRAKTGEVIEIAVPAGLAAEAVLVVRHDAEADRLAMRRMGGAIAAAAGRGELTILASELRHADEVALGVALRAYRFDAHQKPDATEAPDGQVRIMSDESEALARAAGPMAAIAEGVAFTRDLVNEPANVLTTDDFAARLAAMQELGLEVEILEEDELARLGMGALLAVGQGSDSPSKVVVMRWEGGGDEPPLALVGKGVVFDTGGISLKPAAGMEDMTMDMGGAGTVAGTMRALALRRAKANVVGLVGLVENMPSGNATRPGDVVRSMKGDTIEVINTDAEGRLVLADVMWYAQERFKPSGMIDLATLTGAIIVALGHENTGVFSNEDGFAEALLAAAQTEGEGAWRLPMGEAYDKVLKSRVADMRNVGTGREGGSITAAQFLKRFVQDGTPWIHLDIAGTASLKSDWALGPKGATGWGVMALNRLVADRYEG